MDRKNGKMTLCAMVSEVFTTRGKLKAPYQYLIASGMGRNPHDALTPEEQQRIIYKVPKNKRHPSSATCETRPQRYSRKRRAAT